MDSLRKLSISKVVLLLAPMVVSLPFAMDIYVPAVPRIANLFHVTAGTLQLTLTLFMLVSGLIQLIVGPLSDQFGRKPISFIVIFIFTVGTLLCSIAESVSALISYRMIQAAGSCGMMVVGFAVVRDVFEGNESAQTYSILNGIISFSPMFAPFIGSYLDVHYGWPSTFLVLVFFAIWAFLTVGIGLPETLAKTRRIVVSVNIFREYKEILWHPIFLLYTCVTGFGLSYLYLFCSISPYIIIRLLHIPEINYGYYFCFMGISFFIGSFVAAGVVKKFGIYKTVIVGLILSLTGGLLMTIWYFITDLTINNFIWPMLFIGVGGTMCMGAGNGGLMEPFSDKAGAASALSGAIRFIFAAILGSILIRSTVSSTLPLGGSAIVFSVVSLIVFIARKSKLQMTFSQ